MRLKKEFIKFINEEKAQGESNSIFMIIIVAIIAIILIAVVKPMFNKSVKASSQKANLPNQTVTSE
ncbi:MAG: hypothetical protein PHR26_02210 [Candidatus ainarchaeum sp.]|nr:hypothetical protein [Candidatus ainarchaeum sp.]MDD3976202.1 hypothetical protein [Candidatus ainarchaeum sp.]